MSRVRRPSYKARKAITNVFEYTVSVRVMEGTGNGEQGHVPFREILDEEIDNIAFSVDHVCKCRSDSQMVSDG